MNGRIDSGRLMVNGLIMMGIFDCGWMMIINQSRDDGWMMWMDAEWMMMVN